MSTEEFKKWYENGQKEVHYTTEEAEDIFNAEVEHSMDIISDCIPYSDPDYYEHLREAAEYYVKECWDTNSELNRICKEHDDMLDAGLIND